MPYAGPDSPPTTPRARNHRRSYSFTDEKGPGAFISLGALPRAHRKAPPPKLTAFHFQDDEEDDSPEDDTHKHLSIDTQHNLSSNERATANGRSSPPKNGLTDSATVPFPKSSSLSPSQEETPQLTHPQRPPLSRGSSHPILLSNGKPLKSSLKSSPSASSIPDGRSIHLRVRSAPTSPFLSKNVHFPEKKEDGLESVRVFRLKAKPASLSQSGDDTETETETESNRFPVPRSGTYSTVPGRFPLNFDIDYETPGATSAIPTPNPPAYANIHFESVAFQSAPPSSPLAPSSPHLTGTILVRNVAYEKHVAVRFTLDDWQTTSEVSAHHVESVPVLPWEPTQSRTLGDAVGLIANASSAPSTWDRFSFNIRLDDHAYKLHQRVLWLVGRYTTTGDGGGVWWDNNSGSNYRIGFKVVTAQGRNDMGRTVSAPEPVARTINADLTPRQGFRLGFEFRTTMPSPPPSDGNEPSQTTSSTSYFPIQAPSIPPPPVPRAPQRQPRLSLVNYAAPSVSPTTTGPRPSRSPLHSPPLSTAANAPNPFLTSKVRLTPPSSPKDERGRKQAGWSSSSLTFGGNMQTIIGGQLATSSFLEPQSKGITLKWPWGLGSNFTLDSKRGPDYGSSSGSDSPRLRSSPENSSPLSPATPINSNSGSPEGSGTSSPKGSVDTDSDQLYNTFVKQWCFAQSPKPSHNGFSTTDAFMEGVIVG